MNARSYGKMAILLIVVAHATGCSIYLQERPRAPREKDRTEIEEHAGRSVLDLVDDCHAEMRASRSKASWQRLFGGVLSIVGGGVGIVSGAYAARAEPEISGGTPPVVDTTTKDNLSILAAVGAAAALLGPIIGNASDTAKRFDSSVSAWYSATAAFQAGNYDQMRQNLTACKQGFAPTQIFTPAPSPTKKNSPETKPPVEQPREPTPSGGAEEGQAGPMVWVDAHWTLGADGKWVWVDGSWKPITPNPTGGF